MFLFMLVLFPSVLVFFGLRVKDKVVMPVAIGSAVFGVLSCLTLSVLSFRHRIVPFSFFSNWFYFSKTEYILPLLLVSVLYFIITKDNVSFKARNIFVVALAFFAIYMPFCIIGGDAKQFSFFEIFMKPAMILSMTVFFSFFALLLKKNICTKNTPLIVLDCMFLLVLLLLPPAVNALWLVKMLLPVVYLGAVAYCLLSVVPFALLIRAVREQGEKE